VEIPGIKNSRQIAEKLMSKPGIKLVRVMNGQMEVSYDPSMVSSENIRRWVRETKRFLISSG